MSRSPVEIIRCHHEIGAPTALEVRRAAMEQRGEIPDGDREPHAHDRIGDVIA